MKPLTSRVARVALTLLASIPASGQHAMPAQPELLCLPMPEAERRGLDIEKLRLEHVPLFVPGGGRCAFPENREEATRELAGLNQKLAQAFVDELGDGIHGQAVFVMTFFRADGTVHTFLYRPPEDVKSPGVCDRLRGILHEYRFPLASARPFSQCGTIRVQ